LRWGLVIFLPGLASNQILLISTFQVARITGVSHGHLAHFEFWTKLLPAWKKYCISWTFFFFYDNEKNRRAINTNKEALYLCALKLVFWLFASLELFLILIWLLIVWIMVNIYT
jgi:hypothetical protein